MLLRLDAICGPVQLLHIVKGCRVWLCGKLTAIGVDRVHVDQEVSREFFSGRSNSLATGSQP
ncbi:hypothetical protein PCASD_11850 [Puccinia coronata f. sp. avenae]|uniref:Uncharacterized protein n=1 Tax=Puccinia coronata f. sp. avenae TaxID=200324 RepID=A0A2N5UU05_9BASI|nr:hypothetical protein PCASD_11850 [Puccinia coronata f. sp. avenae]